MQTKYDINQLVYVVVKDDNSNKFIVDSGRVLGISIRTFEAPKYFISLNLPHIPEDNVFLSKEEAEKKRELLQVKYDTEMEEKRKEREKWGEYCYKALKEYAIKTYTMNPDKPFEEHLEYILKGMFANNELYLDTSIKVLEEDD